MCWNPSFHFTYAWDISLALCNSYLQENPAFSTERLKENGEQQDRRQIFGQKYGTNLAGNNSAKL